MLKMVFIKVPIWNSSKSKQNIMHNLDNNKVGAAWSLISYFFPSPDSIQTMGHKNAEYS